jgi:Bacteriophage tail sheath protein
MPDNHFPGVFIEETPFRAHPIEGVSTSTVGLVAHAERLSYRIAVVDSGDNQTMPEVRATRELIDSQHAAFYYPWIRVLDPLTQTEISLPPSGFVAGIYARVDRERGVFKAPRQ